MRLIDADALLKKVETICRESFAFRCSQHSREFARDVAEIVKKAPTIEAEPVVHGRWVIQRYYGGMRKGIVARVVCSECFTPNEETNYCPNCGAKMDGERKCDG